MASRSPRPGFGKLFHDDAAAAVARVGPDDVDLLYWTAVSWAAAIGLGKDDPGLVADLPRVSALIDRALAVDESWNHGSIHAFLITWQMVRPDPAGDADQLARFHFDRALELSRGNYSGPWVAWAESVCMPRADQACFEDSLRAALAVDPQAEPEIRLANTVMQRRASWLLEHTDRWFLPPLARRQPSEGGTAMNANSELHGIAVLLACLAWVATAVADTVATPATLRIATVAPVGSSFDKRLQELNSEWSRGPGQVRMNVYAGGSMGGELAIVGATEPGPAPRRDADFGRTGADRPLGHGAAADTADVP